MSKELTKFQAEFKKKIAGALKTTNKKEAKKLTKRIDIAHSNCWEGENYLTESMVPAHKAGIRGNKLTDYMGNKDFKDGYTAYKSAVENLAKEIIETTAMKKLAETALVDAKKLDADIAKDLKKRSGKSQSKSDIEALHKDVKQAITDFTAAVDAIVGVPKGKWGYPATFTKNVQNILKTTPDAASNQKDSTELPQLLQDRNLKSNTNKAAGFVKDIKAKTTDAMDKAGDDDKKAAAGLLKQAAESLKQLKTLNDQYSKIAGDRKMKMAIDNSKDKAAIQKTMTLIDKSYVAAERTLRGTVATIKKAG